MIVRFFPKLGGSAWLDAVGGARAPGPTTS